MMAWTEEGGVDGAAGCSMSEAIRGDILSLAVPELGQLVLCRDRHWIVSDVQASQLPGDALALSDPLQHLVSMSSVEDDGLGEELSVVWELEPGARTLATATLPEPTAGRFDPPEQLAAFLDAVRWGAVTSADATALQAPFRSGISIEDYQLDPVVRALEMPRVNLGIFDDVGLGKTIEAGLVVQELLLRHRARSVWVVCPPNLCLKWQAEMQEKFGLEFRIADSAMVRQLRRDRGLAANVFTHYPRLIVSVDWLKLTSAQRLLDQVLPPTPTYPRSFDLLVVDEVHQCAPSGVGKYATDSLRTKAIRRLAGHFEHRLFLSATPHNGYRESFTALLELLDPQKFARGVEPNEKALARSVVRRLKSTLREDPVLGLRPDGTPRFPRRVLDAIPVAYPDDEREAHRLLAEYTAARRRRAGIGSRREQTAADFVTVMLKKRLFSSPEAFARTLAVHQESLARTASAAPGAVQAAGGPALADRMFDQVLARPDEEDFADDAEATRAAEDALMAAGRASSAPTDQEWDLLRRLQAWADVAAGRQDAKTQRLLEHLDAWLRPGGRWNDERLIIFTEYRDTQNWIDQLLRDRGVPGDRLAMLYGGMDTEARERVKAEFQADPATTPVRILIATDAASEGIDLQRHCWRMVHLEIPWNPNRLEQRNGRIDRHLQPNPEVFIHHFVSAEYEHAQPGSLEADLQFLSTVARKVEQIRDDLGSVGQVLADQVTQAMLGTRRSLDDAQLTTQRSAGARRQLAALERNLRERFQELHAKVLTSRAELGLNPGAIERAVGQGLALGRQSPLTPTAIPATHGYPAVDGFVVPPLTRSWAAASADLYDPIRDEVLPITFDQRAAGRDDVVLAHLGSRLVAQALRLLRAQIWSTRAESRMSRISARIVRDPAVPDLTVIAHARIVITGGDGRRLHEEVISAGGHVRDTGRFVRIDTLKELSAALAAPTTATVDTTLEQALEAIWPQVRDPLYSALEARARTRFDSLARTLAQASERERTDIATLLTELQATIRGELDRLTPQMEQLTLDFDQAEKAQVRADLTALRTRLDAIPEEIVREQALIDARYAAPHPLMFPAAVSILIPAHRAASMEAGR
jgi:superfamily II DNA or RNA helicase